MPVILGIDLEDAANTALADASAVALGEPNLDFGTIVNQANYVLAGAGGGILADIGGAVVQAIVSTLLGGDAGAGPVATIDDLQPILDAIGYGNPPVGSVNADLWSILAYLTSQFGTLAGSIDDIGGADSRDLTQVYDAVSTPEQIWEYKDTNTPEAMNNLMHDLYAFVYNHQVFTAWPVPGSPYFTMRGPLVAWNAGGFSSPQFNPDWTDIGPSDTRVTWLNRQLPTWTWALNSAYGYPEAQGDGVELSAAFYVTFNLSEEEWRHVAESAGVATNVPPIWPGIDNVTLGTPVVITEPTVVDGPMDGLLWETTSAPAGRSRFSVGSSEYAYHAGSIAFVSDNGDIEPYQYIGWSNGLFAARQMTRAASALVAPGRDVTGVATPWTVT